MLVRHIPHSCTHIPSKYRKNFLLSDDDLRAEILRLTDWYTEELFTDDESDEVIFPVSRIVCDPERFLDDELEPAARVGMGVFYTLGTKGQLIRREDDSLREQLIAHYYQPHHQTLSTKVSKYLNNLGKSGVLDCHSFPSVPLPTDDHLSMDRPDFCLGFDEFHVSHELIQECQSLISLQGFTVSINTPYSGCLIPADHYKANSRVLGLMVEVNRGIYMDEQTGEKTDQFSRIQKIISDCILEPFKECLLNL